MIQNDNQNADASRWGLKDWPPAYFALVMATGIVSIACQLLDMHLLAKGLYGLNWVFYAALWVIAGARLIKYPRQMSADLFSHSRAVGFFTWVAATGVLASQSLLVVNWPSIAVVLWWVTIFLWLGFTYSVFTALTIKSEMPNLGRDLHGGWLVAVVATQSVSVSGTLLAAHHGAWGEQMYFVSLVTWLAGGMLYIWLISIIFFRYTFLRTDPADLSPPYWINMGAMAISTLAGALLVQAAPQSTLLGDLLPFLKGMTLLFWGTATWWVPMLLTLGAWRHLFRRMPLRYDPQYWGAVFPLGMYTVCTLKMAQALNTPFLLAIPRVFIWFALLAWSLAALGLLGRLVRRARNKSTA
ncbi:tellurite resistance/C4-dicarboxylate transporter family protein [Bradymonas sediminis]|uniref:C4-dicarboxylate ABC transporter n=1 Tax=Bradymonas sediminis TaxID=1548548 RepID=A0A2Z4FM72_9DELT|nr:tellurite resistance/C4-dicarboxylate transporter family protein [Bradymonas sediminis]AWV90061.1 C4-dicarboxylate ABC transporter [Bradymonas sediminis]TDP75975.1 tellurite resistance protein TehA-like permease [Bradymonas sediminis]